MSDPGGVTTANPVRGGRREEILSSFTAYVALRGYDGTNLSDVARDVGVSKGTIVHHFGTKWAMLEEHHGRYMRCRLEEARLIFGEYDDPRAWLTGLCYAGLYSIQVDRNAAVAFSREIERFRTEGSLEIRQLRRQLLQHYTYCFEEGQARGTFRSGRSAVGALQLLGSVNWAWTWFRSDLKLTAEEVAVEFIENIVWGVARAAKTESFGKRAISDVVARTQTMLLTPIDRAHVDGRAPTRSRKNR